MQVGAKCVWRGRRAQTRGNWPSESRGFDEFKEVMNCLFLLDEAKRLGVVVMDAVVAGRTWSSRF